MFAARMFETVPREQIETLCDGSEDNDAALSLAFIMFLESARMERQIAEDLSCLDALAGGRGAGAAAEFVLAQREIAAKDRDRNQRRKAAAYKALRRKS
jgi:type IV secretory pathway VirB6-like protein